MECPDCGKEANLIATREGLICGPCDETNRRIRTLWDIERLMDDNLTEFLNKPLTLDMQDRIRQVIEKTLHGFMDCEVTVSSTEKERAEHKMTVTLVRKIQQTGN